jgi:hypothetical protein
MSIRINIEQLLELRDVIFELLTRIQKQKYEIVNVPPACYWNMECKDLYKTEGVASVEAADHLYPQPLEEDWAVIRSIVERTDPDADNIGSLVHAASLLRAIGEEFRKIAKAGYCS